MKTIDRPLRIKEVELADCSQAFASDGAPSDCVALGLLGFVPEKIDLVVSGINPMPNLGHDVTYSGTVTVAMEAVIWNIPGIAFSLDAVENHLKVEDFYPAAKVVVQVTEMVIKHRLPGGLLLNVNVPHRPLSQIQGIQITRQGSARTVTG